MNDRSQSGASLTSGSIQLMQNRRLFADDDKGVTEFLNERDANGEGMRVKASYHVQFVDHSLSDGRSAATYQRTVQQKVDDPL